MHGHRNYYADEREKMTQNHLTHPWDLKNAEKIYMYVYNAEREPMFKYLYTYRSQADEDAYIVFYVCDNYSKC